MQTDELTAQEKAASVTWKLASGHEVTTRQVAETYGITWHGAYRMMVNISRVIPIATNSTGVWRRFDVKV